MCDSKRKLRIANFFTDEKFVDSTIKYLSLAEDRCKHDFFFCPYWKINLRYLWKVELKYIKTKNVVRLIAKRDILGMLKDGGYDAVILHSLDSMPYDVIASIPKNIKVLWFAWGFDLYGNHNEKVVQIDLYKPLTKSILKTKSPLLQLKEFLKSSMDMEQEKIYSRAVSRVDFFSGCLPSEFDLCKKCSYFHAKSVDYRYGGPNEFVKDFNFTQGKNILVGNSANPTGNHLDILPYFDGIDVASRKVILPLSYAGPRYYIEKVKKAYRERFGSNCVFLDGFMPADEYKALIDSCSVGVFFHERQQSLGNVNFIIKRGGKVFLSETSVVYNFYKTQKCSIFSLQKDFSQGALDTPLTDCEKEVNLDFIAEPRYLSAKIKRLNDIYDVIQSD